MTNREQIIAILTEHLDRCKEQDKDKRIINALTYAIESIKVDMAYDLEYEKVDFIEIPDGATNGDMIKTMFPNASRYDYVPDDVIRLYLQKDWWNAPYKVESEE